MDISLFSAYISAGFRELQNNRFKVLLLFFAVSFITLLIGWKWPVSYSTSTTIYADNQNILKPLLEKQAEISKVQDRTNLVRDVILSPRILNQVVEEVFGEEIADQPSEMEARANRIRNNLEVRGLGAAHVKIGYSDSSADIAYKVLTTVTDTFITDRSQSKRMESREAFEFIDNQVKQYKAQLVSAEEELKKFKSESFDGRDRDVDASISRIRVELEELNINMAEARARKKSLDEQIENESEFSAKQYRTDSYRERLLELQTAMDNLLLVYRESYPDVVNLRAQIEDIERAIAESDNREVSTSESGANTSINPLYQELRSKLADSEVQIQTIQRRITLNEKLLSEERERRKRIAAREAQAAELNRDYSVTRSIYEDMLERKEKARLSMTLNVEGQGINYRIQEPAVYPLTPTGLTFGHFAMIGPALATMLIIGLAGVFLFLDPRIRFVQELEDFIAPIQVLSVVPHVSTPLSKRLLRSDMVLLLGIGAALLATYIAVTVFVIYDFA